MWTHTRADVQYVILPAKQDKHAQASALENPKNARRQLDGIPAADQRAGLEVLTLKELEVHCKVAVVLLAESSVWPSSALGKFTNRIPTFYLDW